MARSPDSRWMGWAPTLIVVLACSACAPDADRPAAEEPAGTPIVSSATPAPAPFSEHAEDVQDAWAKKAHSAHRKWDGYVLGLDWDDPYHEPAPPEAPLAPSPANYLRLHNTAADPGAAGWDDALTELATAGDDYTLLRLRALDRAALPAERAAVLDRTIAALTARGLGGERPPTGAEIEARLERAAWADIHCDRCEVTLVPWATKSVAPFANDPAVRAELVRLRDDYTPRFEAKTQWSSVSERVRKYAQQLLEGGGEQPATKTP